MNLIHEHACLLRRLAALQARVSEQMGALARERAAACARADAAERACQQLQGTLVRERARLVIASTRWWWGLGGPVPDAVRAASPEVTASPMSAADALCQMGCQGHAHPWLTQDGRCLLKGGDCTRTEGAMVSEAPGAR